MRKELEKYIKQLHENHDRHGKIFNKFVNEDNWEQARIFHAKCMTITMNIERLEWILKQGE